MGLEEVERSQRAFANAMRQGSPPAIDYRNALLRVRDMLEDGATRAAMLRIINQALQ